MKEYHGRDFARDYISKNLEVKGKDVYLFGIYTGWSCGEVGYNFKITNKSPNNFYGFDSLEGLPDERPDLSRQQDWHKGNYNSKTYFNTQDIDSICKDIEDNFLNRSNRSIDLIRGFYSTSLTDDLVIEKNMKPACFIDMDCDLYISAFQALDWLARNELLNNTVIYFDDYVKARREMIGEEKAFYEIINKFSLKTELLFELPSYNQAVYLII